MTALHELIRGRLEGGSRFGIHFLEDAKCPYHWAMRWIAPHPDGGTGLGMPFKDRPLLVGGLFHELIEAYYRSRCTDKSTGHWGEDHGVPDMDAVYSKAIEWTTAHADQWQDPVERDQDFKDTIGYVNRYHDWYGPGGSDPEFPEVRVYVDGTGPWIEREITVGLGPEFQFTCRIDLIATDMGHLAVWEHKTTSASGFHRLCDEVHIDGQPTAELFTLQRATNLPWVPTNECINIVNKNPGKSPGAKTPPFARERVSRSEEQVEGFQLDVFDQLTELNDRCERYLTKLKEGLEPYAAIRACFPRYGMIRKACTNKYSRKCPFWGICVSTANPAIGAAAYSPRIVQEDLHDTE